ncbi:MAG: transcriptional regulator HexR [Halioglobus sp.]
MDNASLLTTISSALPDLKKSEAKVANVILQDPDAATRSSIAVLAAAANVSEPSVNRFCKRFGASGFPDFKLQLAKSLVSGVRYMSRAVEMNDDVNTYPGKLFDNTINALVQARQALPITAIEEAVEHLAKAKRILFFGLGTSAAVAKDAEHKFFRLGIPVSTHDDILMMRMLATSAGAGDVVFFISHTGRTKALVEAANLAHATDAIVVSLTTADSPLASASDCTIELSDTENTDEYLPMTSRIVQLVILDTLATGVTLKRGETLLPHLARIKQSLQDTRFSSDES